MFVLFRSPFPEGAGFSSIWDVTSVVIACAADNLGTTVCQSGIATAIEVFLQWAGEHLPAGFSCPPILVSPKPKHPSASSPLLFGSHAASPQAQPVANCKACAAE